MTAPADERKGMPSASGMERLALCPGSWAASRGLESVSGAEADSGTRIHAHLAGEMPADRLTADEMETSRLCSELEARLVAAWLDQSQGDGPVEQLREQRMWHGGSWGEMGMSGKFDCLHRRGNSGLLIDYKTGRGEVEHAKGNWQLRALVAMVSNGYGLTEVTVAIIQPHGRPQTSQALFDWNDIFSADLDVDEVLDAADQDDAKRVAGEKQCRYCPAKVSCPEARSEVGALVLAADAEKLPALPGKDLSELLSRCAQAEAVIDALRAEARRRIDAGEQVAGWALKPGVVRETVTDPNTVFARATERGVSPAQFMPAVTLNKSKLKDALRAATGAKGKALDAVMDELLDGCTESKAAAPSLVREK